MKWIASRKWAAAVAAASFCYEQHQFMWGSVVTLGWIAAEALIDALGQGQADEYVELEPEPATVGGLDPEQFGH